MHRLRITNNLILSSRILSLNSLQIRFIGVNKSSQFGPFALSDDKIYSKTIISAQNVLKIASPLCNITPFNVGQYEFLRRKNGLLFAPHCSFSRKNVREFSSDSSAAMAAIPVMKTEGILKTLSESAPVEFSQNAFIWLHSSFGLPWWVTIILATWTIRALVTLPLSVYQSYILAKFHNQTDEMNAIVKELKTETNYAVFKYKWTEEYARAAYNRSLKKQRQKLIERDNCHPMKSIILILVQIPMWITISTSLRNLCYVLPYPTASAKAIYYELTADGFGWVTNLTVPDPYYVIPVALGILNLSIIEIQSLMRVTEPSKVQRFMINLFRFFALLMVPLASYVPTAMSLYWASSSAFGIVQNFCLMSPSFRRLTRIPPTDKEISEPYSHLYTNLRHRIGLKNDNLADYEKENAQIRKSITKNR